MKELTVVIPIYKTEKYIYECVDSVLKEAPENSDIILVDDGSPDNCPFICDEYAAKDSRVKVIHQQNSGLSAVRNNAIDVADSKYIFFIDSDDYLEDGYFSKIFSRKADLVIGNYRAFYTDGTPDIIGYMNKRSYSSLYDYLCDFHHHFATVFNFAWGKLYRLDIIKEHNIRFPIDIKMVEDVVFNLEYYRYCTSFELCDDAHLMYRQMNNTLSKQIDPKTFKWYEDSYTRIKNLLDEYGAFTKENEEHYYSHFVGNTMECILGYWKDATQREARYECICNSALLQSSIPYNKSKRLKGIMKSLKNKSIRRLEREVKNYLFVSGIAKFVRRFV